MGKEDTDKITIMTGGSMSKARELYKKWNPEINESHLEDIQLIIEIEGELQKLEAEKAEFIEQGLNLVNRKITFEEYLIILKKFKEK